MKLSRTRCPCCGIICNHSQMIGEKQPITYPVYRCDACDRYHNGDMKLSMEDIREIIRECKDAA